MEKMSLEELIRMNPGADAKLLAKSIRLSKKLKDAGLKAAEYRLATPRTFKSGKSTARTVELQ